MSNKYLSGSVSFRLIFIAVLGISFLTLLLRCGTHQETISYNQHIRPILNSKCLACHGGVRKMGDFSLLFEEEAYAKTESGKKAIVPGNHAKSELYRRIIHHDPEKRMPLEADPLTDAEKELIAAWIDQGAQWEEHWAYIPPKKISPPEISSDWMKNGIDHFVMKRLMQEGLQPEAEADRATLIRRASLDLTGLPPDPTLVETFVSDRSSKAFEKAIDQLLDSPHYGERWATLWLDLARYADSRGYESDPHRNIWRYRNWVINAFNKDLPFDQFTIEQLAGDLLPNPTEDQLLATAFNRNTMTNTEGGTEDEEFRVAAVLDRVNTTFEVWQASTISCVQCHSHPYDPIRHEEFYEVMDFFNHTLDQDLNTEMPNISVYQEEDAEKIEEIIGFIQNLEPNQTINPQANLEDQIRQSLFPLLIPGHCDDFENVTFSGSGTVSNWAYNLQAIGDKKYRFKFSDIDLNGLTHISYTYSINGDDGRVEVRLDQVDGPLINEINFPNARLGRWEGKDFPTIKTPVSPQGGKHDLIFEIINTTGKIPEGMLRIESIELHYKDKYPVSQSLKKYKEQLVKLRTKADKTPIMQEKSASFQRSTRVFERGNWLVRGKEVKAKVPNAFIKNGTPQPHDRLSFSKWLVSKENPLTARVMVNRLWEQLFGTGIIESLEDFGTQSLPASHPELLDYLARQFMDEHEWSIKKLLKEIVMSATYRQSSKTSPEKLESDPFNRLLSRGPRFRLSAEQIRDQALTVSGLLHREIGGESVMPLQPEGVWEVVYSNAKWETPKDELRNRRGLYTYWKRTAPYPSMITFDSPSREFCVSRRIRTNTPLQALVTLNDPVYLEAAQSLGNTMKKLAVQDLDQAIREGYRIAMTKEPDQNTIDILKKLYRQAQEELKSPSPAIQKIAKQSNDYDFQLSEPMTVVANAIMNLDGFVMKE